MAIAYTARHPERVSHLVLVGAYASGRRARARTEDERRGADLQIDMVRLGWGSEDPAMRVAFAPSFIPDAPPELWSQFAMLMRRTTSPTSAARVMLRDLEALEMQPTGETELLRRDNIVVSLAGSVNVLAEQHRSRLASAGPKDEPRNASRTTAGQWLDLDRGHVAHDGPWPHLERRRRHPPNEPTHR